MSLNKRRLLYITFILIFFIITPAILFYAAGYNFNIKNGSIERTGILIIKTNPRDAIVDLGKAKTFNWLYNFFYTNQILTTPLKLRNLLPDKYELTITKNGYFDYRKQIELLPGHTIVLDDILLLKQSTPKVIVDADVLKTKISPDKEKLAVVTDKSIIIVYLSNARTVTISFEESVLNNANFDILWSNSNNKIMLTTPEWPIYNINSLQKDMELKSYMPKNPEMVRWNDTGDDTIFTLKNNILRQINLSQLSTQDFIVSMSDKSNMIKDFMVRDDMFYSIENNTDNSMLNIYNNNYDVVQNIILPRANNYEFTNINDDLIYIKDNKRSVVYIIDPWSLVPIRDTIYNAKELKVLNNNDIIYWNDFEIWRYNFDNKNKRLLTRISKKIDKVAVNANYIIYNTYDGIQSFERDDYNYYNMTNILDWNDTNKLLLNKEENLMYFISWLDHKRVLYSMGIK